MFEQMAVVATEYVAALFVFMLFFVVFSGVFWVKSGVFGK